MEYRNGNSFHRLFILAKYRHWVYIAGMESHGLKQWRERTGYSQGKLAIILGVNVMTVSRWERGIKRPPSFLKLALAYIESEGDRFKQAVNRTKTAKKGGKKDGSIGRVSGLPHKAKRKN